MHPFVHNIKLFALQLKYSLTLFLLFIFGVSGGIQQAIGQSSETIAAGLLKLAGFEEIRVKQSNSEIVCTIERGLYRSPNADLRRAVQVLKSAFPEQNQFRLILLEQGQPVYQLKLRRNEKSDFPIDSIQTYDHQGKAELSWADWNDFKEIQKETVYRSVHSGVSLVIYPQLTLQNMHLDKLYHTQFNIAPALLYSGWKGMLLTAQIIFPIVNEVNYEGDYIRPGFLTLSQRLRLPHLHELRFTAGNFNQNRYGFDLTWKKHFQNSRWSFGGNIGVTGYSNIYANYWNHSPINCMSWNVRGSYFLPVYRLRADLQAGRFLAGDQGAHFDIYRHFGEVTIGIYAVNTGHHTNGGFHFAIPLDPFMRKHRHAVRVMLPSYFDMEYNARNEFVYDRYYETSPNENRSAQDIYPQCLK